MEKLFGLSMSIIMIVLLGVFVATLAVVLAVGLRNRIMVKLGLRNIPRRKGQTVLIIIGIMLSTVIMAAAFGTGDTISYSIRNSALQSLGTIDEVIVFAQASADDNFGTTPYIPIERFEKLRTELDGKDIDGLAPQLAETVPVTNPKTSLSAGRARVVGLDPNHMEGFGRLELTKGGFVSLGDLAEGQAYINERAFDEIEAEEGDAVELHLGERTLALTVAGVVKKGGLAGRDPTVLLPLDRAQDIFGRAGQINLIVVSNRGDAVSGVDLSEDVTRDLRVLFSDREVAQDLKQLLGQEQVLAALRAEGESLRGNAEKDFSAFLTELQPPR